MQISAPGVLEMVEKKVPVPGPGEVLLEIDACGICGADIHDIERFDESLSSPRVPGHEVVGRIAAIGPNNPKIFKLRQRVGVGRLGGHCNECNQCRSGHFNLCINQSFVGSTVDGGYAEMMIVRSSALVFIPEELYSEEAAPILCAGLSTFNALKKSGAEPGDTVAVLGIGGLGHMAIQYARKMGFKVLALGRGSHKAKEALRLGAHQYFDTNCEHTLQSLHGMGGINALVSTITNLNEVAKYLPVLAPKGKLVLLGVDKSPLMVPSGTLVVGERSVVGSITGSPRESEKALDFSVLVGALPRVETMRLQDANEAYKKLKTGKSNFRIVLIADAPIRQAA
jgi:alcohol dehydrogenase